MKENILAAALLVLVSGCTSETNYTCTNYKTEAGNLDRNVQNYRGSGTVRITLSKPMFGSTAQVRYDNTYFISGELAMDDELYISEDMDNGPYPHTTNRLLIDRVTGEGYFQSSRYADANSLPDFRTEQLKSCQQVSKRF